MSSFDEEQQPNHDKHQQQETITTTDSCTMPSSSSSSSLYVLSISYRGTKFEIPLNESSKSSIRMTGFDAKEQLVDAMQQQQYNVSKETVPQQQVTSSVTIRSSDLKLLWKGKVISDNTDLYELLIGKQQQQPKSLSSSATTINKKKPFTFKLVAVGISHQEMEQLDHEMEIGIQQSSRIVRDDLSLIGKHQLQQRQRLGRNMFNKVASKQNGIHDTSSQYGFGMIETLPNLPNEETAKKILQTLANDPGILACMKKHSWNVGRLCELFPDGKVGQSPVCVMGLNQNNGQKIFLRLRTDDLHGFRKILSIRKVLYHELAHNVHSEHNTQFFQLMRQIEKECIELDWTNGAGLSDDIDNNNQNSVDGQLYTGGTYRLGGGSGGGDSSSAEELNNDISKKMSIERRRELAARAAESRKMTDAEAEEIEQNCGCSLPNDLFLPKKNNNDNNNNNRKSNNVPQPNNESNRQNTHHQYKKQDSKDDGEDRMDIS